MAGFEWIVLYLLLGAFAGFMAGLLGVGGGGIVVPLLSSLLALQGMGGDKVRTSLKVALRYMRSDTTSKLLPAAMTRASFICLFASLGSIPSANWLLALRAFSLARANVTAGYTPRASLFSLPEKKYFRNQRFAPLGEISKYKLPPSGIR